MFRKIITPTIRLVAPKRAIACPADEPSFCEMVEINYNEASKLVEQSLMAKAKETYSLMDSVERKSEEIKTKVKLWPKSEVFSLPCDRVTTLSRSISRFREMTVATRTSLDTELSILNIDFRPRVV